MTDDHLTLLVSICLTVHGLMDYIFFGDVVDGLTQSFKDIAVESAEARMRKFIRQATVPLGVSVGYFFMMSTTPLGIGRQ